MDKLQLLILKKQYEILKLLEPKNRDHDLAWRAIDSGFELEIERLVNDASIEPVSGETCQEVCDILNMFRNLQNSLRQNGASPEQMNESLFPGFDGNEETGHYAYALYLLDDKGLWKGLSSRDDTWNSHHPTLEGYRSMLRQYRDLDSFPHSGEEVASVIAAYRDR